MLMLVLNETINQFTVVNSVSWYGNVLRREDCHVVGRTLDFVAEGERMKGRLRKTQK